MSPVPSFRKTLTAAAAAAVFSTALVLAAAPAFTVVNIGAGSPLDVNSSGTVVGVDGSATTAQPWIVENGTRTFLPLPPGMTSALVSRVSENGVVIGHSDARPLMWKRDGAAYTVSLLPLPAGTTGALPVAVDSSGAVLMNCGTPTIYNGYPYFSSANAFLFTEASGLVDLGASYGLTSIVGADMTETGRILTTSGRILEPDGGVTPAPAPPAGWANYAAARLNEHGAFVAKGYMSTSDGHAALGRYVPGSGWLVIHTMIGSMYASSADGIDDNANVIVSAFGGISLTTADGRTIALGDLTLGQPFGFPSAGAMADDGHVAARARDANGVGFAALLEPAGNYPVPDAVVLTGVAHPATSQAPWDAISLTWTASTRAKSYIVERKGPSDATFVALTPSGGTIQLKYDDTSVAPLTTYTYRVLAAGVGGTSGSSNEVVVVSPGARDSVAPTARFTSPAAGAVITGTVVVTAEASDAVGLAGFEIRYHPNQGNEVLCARSYSPSRPSDTLSCSWNPGYMAPGTVAQLIASAWDEIGNYVQSPISVTYRPGSTTPDTKAPKVTIIAPVRNATVSGVVTVQATATDNVGVTRMEVRTTAGAILATSTNGAITYGWNTTSLRKGSTQTLVVRAYDAKGNSGSANVVVRIAR